MSKLGFEPQISGFTHRRLNQLVHRDTYTNSETNLSLIHISIEDSQNVILVNTILQFILESNPQVGILFGFTLYIN